MLIVEALAMQPNDFNLLGLQCRVRLVHFDYRPARELARQLISIAPGDSEGYLFLAWAIIDDKSHHPQNAAFDEDLDQWKVGLEGRIKACHELLQTCLELDPTDPRHYMLKAKLAYLEEDSQGAIHASEEGLRYAPANESLHHYRILGFEQSRDSESLKTALDEQLARSPEDAFVHHKLSEIYLANKETDKAISHARDAIRINPDDEDYKDSYWDAVMASNPYVRPFVNLRYSVKWFHRIPNWAQTAVIMLIGLVLGIALIVGEKFGDAVSGAVICVGVILLLLFSVAVASDRPFMAMFDLFYYFRDSRFRISTKDEKRDESLLFVGTFLTAVVVLVSAAFKVFLPIALLLLAIPAACIYFATPWKIRCAAIAMTLLAIFLLWQGMTIYPETRPRSLDRVFAMYYFMGFIATCIAAGVVTKVWIDRSD